MTVSWINLLHTTELGEQRIKCNLELGDVDVVNWCKQEVLVAEESAIVREGKNWYVHGNGVVLTINAHSYTIITAKRDKIRKMLCRLDTPYIERFMRLVESQSKATIGNWGLSYASEHILPIYEKAYPNDGRIRISLRAAQEYFMGTRKFQKVNNDCSAAAKEAKGNPAAEAAARACHQAVALAHTPRHSIGVVFYGTAAIVYHNVGLGENPETYDRLAEEECAKMEASLRAIAVENEPNQVKIHWSTFTGKGSLFQRC